MQHLNKTIPVFMVGHHCPPEIQQFSSLSEVYSFAHSHCEKYKSLFVVKSQVLYPRNYQTAKNQCASDHFSKPHSTILTISADYLLSGNRF
jgi:hypothetical protein